MYHVNPPDIENRVRYTITTRADNRTGYAHIGRCRVCTYQDARPAFRLRNGCLGDTVGRKKGFARKQRLIRTKNTLRSACTSGLVFPHLMGWKRSGRRFCPCRVCVQRKRASGAGFDELDVLHHIRTLWSR